MSIAEWHKSKMENPVYRSNIRSGIAQIVALTPLLWTFCLGFGSIYCIMGTLRTDYGPRIGNDGVAFGIVLLPAVALLCFKAFWVILRKSPKATLRLAAVTNISFFATTVWLVSR